MKITFNLNIKSTFFFRYLRLIYKHEITAPDFSSQK